MKDQSKQPAAAVPQGNTASTWGGQAPDQMSAAQPGGSPGLFTQAGGNPAALFSNSSSQSLGAPYNDAMIPPTGNPATTTGQQAAPPGYHYSADGMLLLGSAPGQAGAPGAPGAATPTGGISESGLDVAHSNWGPTTTGVQGQGQIQFGLPSAGGIQSSFDQGGQIQNTLGNAGNIQSQLDLSGLPGWATNASYGKITDKLDTSNVPALVSGDALRGMTDDARNAAYKSATAYLDPSWQQREQDLANTLANQGVMQNSEAWNKAMSQLGRERTFAYDQAFNNSFAQGLNAQNQLFGQGLAANQNQFGQNLAGAQFSNAAQAQGFGQSLANAQLQNQARQAMGNEAIAGMTLGNAAQAQQFGQNLAAGQFGNQAAGQQYAQNLGAAQFGNQAQNQLFGQNATAMGLNNAAQGQSFAQGLQNAQLGNAMQGQLADQWLRQYQIQTGLAQTNRSAQATENAAASAAGASTANMNAQLAAQAAQNQFANSLALRNQGLSEAQLAQQNPWNLLNMIYGNSGNVGQPNFTNTPGSNVGSPDVTGAYNNQYQGQLNAYNANVGQQNTNTAAMATILAAMLCDRRLKKNVREIGRHASGVALYEYDYLWGEHGVGVMADELEAVRPDAVITLPCGYKAVDYARI